MDEQRKEGFDFQPGLVKEAEAIEPDDKKYDFGLFEPSKGQSAQSGEKARSRKPAERTAPRKPVAVAPINEPKPRVNKELPTDVFGDEPKVSGVSLNDDFQIGGGFKAAELEEPAPAPERKERSTQSVPERNGGAVRSAQKARPTPPVSSDANRGGKGNNAKSRPHSEAEESNTSIAEYIMKNKIKVLSTFVLAVIAIIAIAVMGSKMRIDIFGITNVAIITMPLILAVLFIVIGTFIKQKHRVIYGILWTLIILIIASCFAGLLLSGVCDFFGISRIKTISDFTVPEGGNWGTEKISEELYNENIINHPMLFRLYSKIKGNDGSYQWGNYEFDSEMAYDSIMDELKRGNEAATIQVRIPEVSSVDQIIAILEENNVCTRDQFIEAMNDGEYSYSWVHEIPVSKVRYRFEGYLYPDTYNFYAEPSVANAKRAIEKMLNGFNSHLPENWKELVAEVGKRIDKPDMTLNDAMAIGSILELEASGNPNEMKNVASVFYNRLTWSEPHFLGSTPTYYYVDNRYNTNAGPMTVELEDGSEKTYPAGSEGIPPGPQCSLTGASILASLQPAQTEYTYFVTDIDMNFYYNKSYTAHLNTIAQLRNSGKWA